MKKITVALIALVLVCSSAFAGVSVTAGAGYGGQAIPKKDCLLDTDLKTPGLPRELAPSFFLGIDYETDNNISLYGDVYYTLKTSKLTAPVPSAEEFTTAIPTNKNAAIASLITPLLSNSFSASYVSANVGAGYTFHVTDDFSFMVGAGLDAKYYFVTASAMALDSEYEALQDDIKNAATATLEAAKLIQDTVKSMFSKTIVIGAGLKLKGTYKVDEHWGVSAQLNPTFNFKVISNPELEKNKTADVADDSSGIGKVALNGMADGFSTLHSQAMLVSGSFSVGATYRF